MYYKLARGYTFFLIVVTISALLYVSYNYLVSLYIRSFTSEVIDVATAIKQSDTQIIYWRFILINQSTLKLGKLQKTLFFPLYLTHNKSSIGSEDWVLIYSCKGNLLNSASRNQNIAACNYHAVCLHFVYPVRIAKDYSSL